MHIVSKQRTVTHSLVQIDFCCADCVKSFQAEDLV